MVGAVVWQNEGLRQGLKAAREGRVEGETELRIAKSEIERCVW